jgi:nucleoside-diphosphate-sugar epimerase
MTSRRRVLITGANGYIGARAVAHFLDAGWAVRGAVRDPKSDSARELAAHFASREFELVTVPDIKAAGAFDNAAQGVQAIAHLATPVVFDSGDVEYIVGTAVRGTLSILDSALKAGESLKSFVFMSSTSAVRMRIPGPCTFTEKDWNTQAEAQIKEDGDTAFGHVIYAASKVASERAFWGWVKEKKPSFAATALCPW